MTTLIIAEHDNTDLLAASRSLVSAASAIGNPVHVLVAGSGCSAVAAQAATLPGIDKVLLADGPALEHALAENLAAQVHALAADYEHILFAATSSGKNVAPRVAAMLDVAQVSEVLAIESADTFVHPIYAGNAFETVRCTERHKVLTIRLTAFDPIDSGSASVPVDSIDAVADSGLSRFAGRELGHSDRPDLASARVVISGGRALDSADNFKLLDQLADKLGAAIGASRAAVDAGYAPNDWQVGQTGKIVAPELYIAIGISGAIQHLAGMKDSRVIVAINKDAEAPIFGVADYGLVADLFEAVPELIAAL